MKLRMASSFPDIGILENDLGDRVCFYCLKPIGILSREEAIDHVYPVARGGPNSDYNYIVSCQKCNSMKHDKDPIEWWSEDVIRNVKKMKIDPYFWLLIRFDYERRVNASIIYLLQKKFGDLQVSFGEISSLRGNYV